MRKKRKWHRELMIVLAAIITGTGCFFAGVAASSSRYQAEREMNAMLNRSDLDGLGGITGTIYVTMTSCFSPSTTRMAPEPSPWTM